MKTETLMVNRFRSAGGDIGLIRLRSGADTALRNVKGSIADAAPILVRALQKDDEMLHALARQYLGTRGEELRSEGQYAGAGNGHLAYADAPQPERDGDAKDRVPSGHHICAEPSHLIANGEGHAPGASEGHADRATPVREPITLSEAGRMLQKARPPGAGALKPRPFESVTKLRSESWLISYQIPGGPPVLELRWDDAEAMLLRMFREAAERGTASIILAALIEQKKKHGIVHGNAKIGETLTPAEIASVAENYTPEKIHAKGRALVREFQKRELGTANA